MYSISFHIPTHIHQTLLNINKSYCTSCTHNTFKIKA